MFTLNQQISLLRNNLADLKINSGDFSGGIIEYTISTISNLDDKTHSLSGSLDELIRESSASLDTLSGKVTSISGSLDTLSGKVTSISGSLDTLTGDVTSISGSLDTLTSNLQRDKQDTLTNRSDISLNNLRVTGDLIVDGSFNINNLIQNDITINNEILISTQLDISNEGTGPALKVTQLGIGPEKHVALFNAGEEGDSLLIDSSGNITIYKTLEVIGDVSMNEVKIKTLYLDNININHFVTSTSGSFETISSNVGSISGSVDTLSGKVTSISGSVDTLFGNVISTNQSLDTLSGKVTSISGSLDTLITNVNSTNQSLDTLSGKVTSISGSVDTLFGNVISTNQSLDTLSGKVTSISGSLDTLSGKVTSISGSLDTLTSDVTSISGSLDTLTSNLQRDKQDNITNNSDLSLNNLRVTGDLNVDGSFNIRNVIQNDITINNEILISTQLDISNEGTGPALKVTQLGSGPEKHVALFNAGEEGDSLLIDSAGNTIVYKKLDVIGDVSMNDVKIKTLNLDNININHFVTSTSGSFETITSNVMSISGSVDTLSGKVTSISGSVDTLVGNVNSTNQSLDTLSGKVTSISGSLDTLITNINSTNQSLDTLSGKVTSISGSVDTLTSNVISISGSVDTLVGNVISTNQSLDTLTGKVTSISGSVDTLVSNVISTNQSLDTLSGKVTSISGSVDTLFGNVNSTNQSLDTLSGKVTSISGSVDTLFGNVNSTNQSLDTLSGKVTSISGSVDTLVGNVGHLQRDKQDNITVNSDLSLSNLHVTGDLFVDGSFNIRNVIQNDITINNEILISTQLDISNEGTGPALKVTQLGSGPEKHVALFNAGEEGDSLLIDSSGNITIYKTLEVIGDVSMNDVIINTLHLDNININHFVTSTSGSFETITSNVSSISGSVDTLASKVTSISGSVDTLITNVISISGSVLSISGSLETLTGKVTSISGSVDTLSGKVTSISGSVDTLSGKVTSISGSVDTLSGKVTSISGSLDTFITNVISISGSVLSISGSVDTLFGNVNSTNQSLDTLSGKVTSISGSVDTLFGNVNSISGSVDTLVGNVNSISGSVDTLVGNVNSTNQSLDTLSGKVTSISGSVDTLVGNVNSISGSVDTLVGNVNSISGSVDTLSGKVTSISGSVDTLITNVGHLQRDKQDNITVNSDLSLSNLHVTGNLFVDGSFNIRNVIQNDITINNEILISTQLDISNEGTGPALKVTQLGSGNDKHVALFNAGEEGDSLLIDSSGNITIYKKLEVIDDASMNNVRIETLDVSNLNIDNESLAISKISGLANVLSGLQPTITANALSISDVSGLQTSLGELQNKITESTDLSFGAIEANHGIFNTIDISNITGSGLQPLLIQGTNISIIDNVISVSGEVSQSQLDSKQDNITETTDLSFRTIEANHGIFDTIDVNNITGSGLQPLLSQGTNISIIDNVISVSGEVSQSQLDSKQNIITESTDLSFGDIEANHGIFDTIDIGNISGSGLQPLITNESDISLNNLHVLGDLFVDGSFNIRNVIQNDITVNNEILISTQLDISNQGTGPALKVTQLGSGPEKHVALFNAGEEGDSLLIDSSGNITIYKSLEVIGDVSMNNVRIHTLDVSNLNIDNESLAIDKIIGLSDELAGLQSVISTNDLSISDVSGLQIALDNKYDDTGGTITGSVTISGDLVVGTTNIITEIGTKQDEINTGDLSITDTDGLESALNAKQDDITEETDLSFNSITTNDLVVNESLNIDNKITYEKDVKFDTIVVKRKTNPQIFHTRELQLWVNGVNILPTATIPSGEINNTSTNSGGNSLEERIEFFTASNNTTESSLTINGITYLASNVVNGIINGFGITDYDNVGASNSSLYIPLNITIKTSEVQAIVLYNRTSFQSRANGLAIELYNRADDPTLSSPLLSTNELENGSNVYRYDFPAIDTYSSFVGQDSSTNIVNETYSTREVVSITTSNYSILEITSNDVSMTGDLNVGGDLVVGTTNILTEIATKQDEIKTDDLSITDVSGLRIELNGLQSLITDTTDLSFGDIEANHGIFDTIDISNITGSGLQPLITNNSDISLSNLHVTGNLFVDGSFNIQNVIQNDITINNEILVSTQLDISNEGTGPALKVTQLGSGPDKHVALFNAGEEGDSLLIDSSGNTTIYKSLEVIGDVSMNKVDVSNLNVSGTAIVHDLSINGTLYYSGLNVESNTINPDSDISVNSLYVRTNTIIQEKMAISMDICDNYVLSISGDVYLKGRLKDEFGDEYIGTSGSDGIFTSNDNLNYTTNKNVNIGTSDICSNYTLNVNGGVRLYDGASSYELFNYNDWIPDLCNNIYYTNGNVGIGTYNHSTPYILDIHGGVRIKSSYDSLNIIDVSGGWASAQDYIYYPNKVVIGGTTDVGDDSKLYVNGTITADVLNLTSDKRLKEHIEDVSNSLTILRQLYPKKYSKGSNTEIGFIANDVLNIDDISFVVSTTNAYYSLNYNSLFSLSIQAVKDLDAEVNELKTKNKDLEQRLEALEHFIYKNM